jgi:hypothetical protein
MLAQTDVELELQPANITAPPTEVVAPITVLKTPPQLSSFEGRGLNSPLICISENE